VPVEILHSSDTSQRSCLTRRLIRSSRSRMCERLEGEMARGRSHSRCTLERQARDRGRFNALVLQGYRKLARSGRSARALGVPPYPAPFFIVMRITPLAPRLP
jgi:hypothetical protein